jgi:hypothetical protein
MAIFVCWIVNDSAENWKIIQVFLLSKLSIYCLIKIFFTRKTLDMGLMEQDINGGIFITFYAMEEIV